MKNNPNVEHLADSSVDDEMDRELRKLLTTCFKKPQDVVFQEHRHFVEPPAHRWFIRNESGELIAHTAVHDKSVEAGGQQFRIGGIAEVCVHPDYRGRGYVRLILSVIHKWLAENGFQFAVLFGATKVYTSSGYVSKKNVVHDAEVDGKKARKYVTPMVVELSDVPWPTGEVYLPGPTF
jgi:predicted acetyltransferase